MNANGHTDPSQSVPDAPCPWCGVPANSDSEQAVVEVQGAEGRAPQDMTCLVWHQDCYDEFLDRGEEC